MSAEIARSRFIRGIVLDLLWTADGAGSRFGFTFEQLARGFGASRVEVAIAELRRELNDLAADQLVRQDWDDDLRCDHYTIGPRGRDFKRAGCPWDRIDEFTGKVP